MAKTVAQRISLKPQRELFDPDFEGYKLSSENELTVYSRQLSQGVQYRVCQSTCYLHTRLKAFHNHLFQDPFHPLTVYFFNTAGHLVKCSYSEDTRLSEEEVTWQAEIVEAEREGEYYYPPTLKFPSANLAVVSDGRGRLTVLKTDDRNTTHSWVVSSETECEQGVIADACVRGENKELHCVVVSITSPSKLHSNPDFVVADDAFGSKPDSTVHLIRWIVLTEKGVGWEVSCSRALAGQGVLEYCAVDSEGSGLLLLCHSNYFFVSDSSKPITKPEPEKAEKSSANQPKFTFQQTDEDLTVWLKTGSAIKNDVKVKITVNELEVHIHDTPSLHAHFLHPIKADLATWTIGEGRLELVLPKASEGMKWESLFNPEDDVFGEEVLDPTKLEEINQNLAHLTSDKLNPDPSLDKPAYDPEQLEECDTASEDLLLVRLDGSSHQLSNYGQLGATQHLFNLKVDETSVPAFCIRYDVDAVLWEPRREVQFKHLTTYHAFGYVRASKTTAKFTCGAQDLSYVAVADVRSHVYVFFQPEALQSEVRNRKSGRRLHRIARQLVISLKSHSEVLGLCASNNILFVLTDKTLYAYCINHS